MARGARCLVRRTAPWSVVLAFVRPPLTTMSPRVAWGSRIKSAGHPILVDTGDTCDRLEMSPTHHEMAAAETAALRALSIGPVLKETSSRN